MSPADLPILHHDDWLLAVAKPAGLPVHATADPRRDHLEAQVRRWLQAQGQATDGLVLLHRLDVETSGLVLFARQPDAARALARAFADRRIAKTYLALTAPSSSSLNGPPPPDAWTVADHLKPVRERGRERMVPVRSGGDRAVTDLRVLVRGAEALLVQASPRTGRRHQIRAHLAGQGLPILGDELYGPAGTGRAPLGPLVRRCMLHAWQLSLEHPATGQPLHLICPPPLDFTLAAQRWLGPNALEGLPLAPGAVPP